MIPQLRLLPPESRAVRSTLRRLSRGRGKIVAHALGVSQAGLSSMIHGTRPIPPILAAAVGHKDVLDRIRAEELELAARIEAELLSGTRRSSTITHAEKRAREERGA